MFTDEKLTRDLPPCSMQEGGLGKLVPHGQQAAFLLSSFPLPGLHLECPERDTGQRKPVPQELSLQLKGVHDAWRPQPPAPPRALQRAA